MLLALDGIEQDDDPNYEVDGLTNSVFTYSPLALTLQYSFCVSANACYGDKSLIGWSCVS